MVALEFVKVYLDGLLIISMASLEDHLKKLTEVLYRLQDTGLKINAIKSKFCALESNWGMLYPEMVFNLKPTKCR